MGERPLRRLRRLYPPARRREAGFTLLEILIVVSILIALAALMAVLPNPPLTRDQVKLMKQDNVLGGEAPSLQDLGIAPTPVEDILPGYLRPN